MFVSIIMIIFSSTDQTMMEDNFKPNSTFLLHFITYME